MNEMSPLVSPGNVTGEYGKDYAASLSNRWLDVFGKNKQGIDSKAYLWHIFCANRYPCVCGSEALAQYRAQVAPEYIVLSNDRDYAFTTDERPEQASLADFYVFPENLAWTMAYTHEDGWCGGPYFARHEQYTRLNELNLAKLKKAREIELAKKRGWL